VIDFLRGRILGPLGEFFPLGTGCWGISSICRFTGAGILPDLVLTDAAFWLGDSACCSDSCGLLLLSVRAPGSSSRMCRPVVAVPVVVTVAVAVVTVAVALVPGAATTVGAVGAAAGAVAGVGSAAEPVM